MTDDEVNAKFPKSADHIRMFFQDGIEMADGLLCPVAVSADHIDAILSANAGVPPGVLDPAKYIRYEVKRGLND